MVKYFSKLNYSFGNEDWASESQALRIGRNDRVLCVTASGDRPLHVLLDQPQSVVSVDSNPAQNHLLELKCAAMRDLPYQEYLGFLGAKPSSDRESCFRRLAEGLPADTKEYWNSQIRALRKGILYQGTLERGCAWLATGVSLTRPGITRQLFEFQDLDQQRKFVTTHWNTAALRWVLRIFFDRRVAQLLRMDPCLYRYTDPNLVAGPYFCERMNNSLMSLLARKNPFLDLFLNGTVAEEAWVPYLTQPGYESIRQRTDRLSVHTADLVEFIESSPENSFDCFSLSDVASYIPYEAFVRLLRGVLKAGRPGARVCIRQFLSSHTIPADLQRYFKRDVPLEKKLDKEEPFFCYRFMVSTLAK